MQVQNQYLDYFSDSNFQRVNRHFLLSFGDKEVETGYTEHFLPKGRNKTLKCHDKMSQLF